MRAILLFVKLNFITSLLFAQPNYEKANSIGLSYSSILNRSKGVFYTLGNRNEPQGSANGNFINFEYKRTLVSRVYVKGSVGIFNQSFKIIRPFNFIQSDNLLRSTRSYKYNGISWSLGIGWNQKIDKSFQVSVDANYHSLHSFSQKYIASGSDLSLDRSEYFQIGRLVTLIPEITKNMKSNSQIGIAVVLPINVKWENDEGFIKSDFSTDSQVIAINNFSIGISLSYKIIF